MLIGKGRGLSLPDAHIFCIRRIPSSEAAHTRIAELHVGTIIPGTLRFYVSRESDVWLSSGDPLDLQTATQGFNILG